MGKTLPLVKSCLCLKFRLQASSHPAYCMKGKPQYLPLCPDIRQEVPWWEAAPPAALVTCAPVCVRAASFAGTGEILVVLGPHGPGLASLWGFGDAKRDQVERWLYCVRKTTHCSGSSPALLVFENSLLAVHLPALLLCFIQVAKGTWKCSFSAVERDPRKWRN